MRVKSSESQLSCSQMMLGIQEGTLCGEDYIASIPVLAKVYTPSHCMVISRDPMRLYPTSLFRFSPYNNETSPHPCVPMRKDLGNSKRDLSEEPIVKITLHRPM